MSAHRHRSLIVALSFFAFFQYSHAADEKWWATSSPTAVQNGSITLKNASGTQRSLVTNPTGANLSTRTATTQPPTVIVQATASLPIKSLGDTCTATTSGTSPNQTASEGTAISLDRSTLFTCQPEAIAGNTCTPVGSKAVQVSGGVVTYLICQ